MNKTFLVTGCSSGIGHYITQKLIIKGSNVIGIDYHKYTPSSKIQFHQIDLTNESLVKEVFESLSSIDFAINCAGVSAARKDLTCFSSNEILDEWGLNFLATFNPLKYEILKMRTQNKGSIVNISSITAHRGMEGFTAYSSAKSSILSITKVAAIENSAFNIRVNSISPATIDTPMIRKKSNGKLRDYTDVYFTGHCGTTHDVFLGIEMLLHNEFLTGYDLRLDGGVSDLCVI